MVFADSAYSATTLVEHTYGPQIGLHHGKIIEFLKNVVEVEKLGALAPHRLPACGALAGAVFLTFAEDLHACGLLSDEGLADGKEMMSCTLKTRTPLILEAFCPACWYLRNTVPLSPAQLHQPSCRAPYTITALVLQA